MCLSKKLAGDVIGKSYANGIMMGIFYGVCNGL
jgi:hypothetical protein